MSFLPTPTPALLPRTELSGRMALLYAAIIVVMAVAQLFTFEKFLPLLASYGLFAEPALAQVFGSVLVAAEVFALPFLLRMAVSSAFRWVSMVCGWVVAAAWLKLSLWYVAERPNVDAAGFLGSIEVAPGWWMVFFSLALCLLAIWSAWGQWPGARRK